MNHHAEDFESSDNRYLWEGTGPVDLEIASLERRLAPLRYTGRRSAGRKELFAYAAAVMVAAVAFVLVSLPAPQSGSSWTIAREGKRVEYLNSGQTIATGSDAPVQLQSREIGSVTIEPNSRARLLQPAGGKERVALDYGALRAFIWAPPAKFSVATPAATAIDLGCIYTLQTDRNGNGNLRVEVGWVALQAGNLEAFIPAGASCRMHRGRGPGLPVYEDASDEFRVPVRALEQSQAVDLARALAHARPKDALTLWHLIPRTDGEVRKLVVARFAKLVSLPEKLTDSDLIAAKPETMDAAWSALHLGSTEWWRTWRQPW